MKLMLQLLPLLALLVSSAVFFYSVYRGHATPPARRHRYRSRYRYRIVRDSGRGFEAQYRLPWLPGCWRECRDYRPNTPFTDGRNTSYDVAGAQECADAHARATDNRVVCGYVPKHPVLPNGDGEQ